VVFESKSVIVKSDNVFFSHRLDNNCSDTSAGKKASGCLKVSRVAELGASLNDVLPVVVSKATSVLLLFSVQISCWSKTYAALIPQNCCTNAFLCHLPEMVLLLRVLGKFVSLGWTLHRPRTLPQIKSMQTSWRLLGDSNILCFCCHSCNNI